MFTSSPTRVALACCALLLVGECGEREMACVCVRHRPKTGRTTCILRSHGVHCVCVLGKTNPRPPCQSRQHGFVLSPPAAAAALLTLSPPPKKPNTLTATTSAAAKPCPVGAGVAITSLTYDPKTALVLVTATVSNKGQSPLRVGRVGVAVYGTAKNADGSPIYDGVSGIDCAASSVAPGKTVVCRWAEVGGGRIDASGHNNDAGVDQAALKKARAFSPSASVSYTLTKGLKPSQVSATATWYESDDFMGPQGFVCGPSPRVVAK